MAVAFAPENDDHARRLIDKAEVIARTIPNEVLVNSSARTLCQLVLEVMTGGTAARTVLGYYAERIARSIDCGDGSIEAEALTTVAENIFAEDPGRAERAALAIYLPHYRVKALVRLADLSSKSA